MSVLPQTLSPSSLPPALLTLTRRVRARGGTAWLVGGAVRDSLLGLPVQDHDLEIFGITEESLRKCLHGLGRVTHAGKVHPMYLVGDSSSGFQVGFGGEEASYASLTEGCRRRDLTINALLADPLRGILVDPLGGLMDLFAGRLHPCSTSFGTDPLRVMRVMRFAGTHEFRPTPSLLALCRQARVEEADPSRVFGELERLLLQARRPSLGLRWLPFLGLGPWFPEVLAMRGVPQDPQFHPEGEVWTHTLMVVDEAALLRVDVPEEDLPVMLAALFHDLGKATTTFASTDGRIRSPGHDTVGAVLTRRALDRLGRRGALAGTVEALVREHLHPAQLHKAASSSENSVSDGAIRRLMDRIPSLPLLLRLARADHLGRTLPRDPQHPFPAGDWLLQRASSLGVSLRPLPPLLLGRDLLALGLPGGPEVGKMLRRVRELQLDGTLTSREEALQFVKELGQRPEKVSRTMPAP